MRHSRTGGGVIVVLVLAICGSLVGTLIGGYLPWVGKYVWIGFDPPVTLNLVVLRLTFGLTIQANLGTVVGAVLGTILAMGR